MYIWLKNTVLSNFREKNSFFAVDSMHSPVFIVLFWVEYVS